MTSQNKNPLPKEDANYKLNMEILSSLKSIPGKIVNLQSENFINEELNKKLPYQEGKKTTSSSISKVSNDIFCMENKKIITNNSVFKPMMILPQKKSTMNYFPYNTLMSLPDFYLQSPIGNVPHKVTNSSFSRNSFCVMNNPNIDPNNNILNQLSFTPNPMNTFTQFNQFNLFGNPLTNSINSLNLINTPQFPINDIYLNNNFINNNNDLNKNIFLNQKRNSEEKEIKEIKEDGKINNLKKSIFFKVNQQQKQKKNLYFDNNNSNNITSNMLNSNSIETTNKKNLFMIITKSSYKYKKRKPRKKKIFNSLKKKVICSHPGCEATFKTKKQLIFHHYKMNPQCHNDTISILKMIYKVKILLKNKNFEKNKAKFGELYKQTMKNISLDEHIETLVGYNFEDEIIEK